MTQKKRTTLLVIIAAVAALAVAAIALLPKLNAAEPSPESKTITLEAVFEDGSEKSFTVKTEESFLGPALRAQGIITGEDGAYGFFVTGVDGVEADGAREQWWSLMKDGEMTPLGIDETPISDGDVFRLALMTGFDESAA